MAANIKYPLDMNTQQHWSFLFTHRHTFSEYMWKISLAHMHNRTQCIHTSSFMHAHTIYQRRNDVQCVCIIGPCMLFYPHQIAFETSYYARTHIHSEWRTPTHTAATTNTARDVEHHFECVCVFVRLWWIFDGNIATSGFKITCSLFRMFESIRAFSQYRFVLRLNSVIFLILSLLRSPSRSKPFHAIHRTRIRCFSVNSLDYKWYEWWWWWQRWGWCMHVATLAIYDIVPKLKIRLGICN